MKKFTACAAILLALATPAFADKPAGTKDVPDVVKAMEKKYGTPQPTVLVQDNSPVTLDHLVAMQRIAFPEAWVSSTFYDYRTVSMYRRHPGLHLGYDIAMPAGYAVRAAWAGTVISIAPWSDLEWGVTVRSSNGIEATYGHISPAVKVGDTVLCGTIVGHVARDHVDVKMRDASGNYIPFGEGSKLINAGGYVKVVPTTSKEQLMTAWLAANNSVESMEMELEAREREIALAKTERSRLETRYAELKKTVALMEQYYDEGLISRMEAEKAKLDVTNIQADLRRVKKIQADAPKRAQELKEQLAEARKKLQTAGKNAKERGISWADVNAFVNEIVRRDQELKQKVLDYKKEQSTKNDSRRIELKKEIEKAKADLQAKSELYEMGGLPRKEWEAAQEKLKMLEDELKSLDK